MTKDTDKGGEVFVTSSTRLATALLSLGETLQRPPCTRQVRRDGSTIVTFLFESGSCGKHASVWMKLQEQDPGTDTPDALQARIKWLGSLDASDSVATAYLNAAWRDIALMIVKATRAWSQSTALTQWALSAKTRPHKTSKISKDTYDDRPRYHYRRGSL